MAMNIAPTIELSSHVEFQGFIIRLSYGPLILYSPLLHLIPNTINCYRCSNATVVFALRVFCIARDTHARTVAAVATPPRIANYMCLYIYYRIGNHFKRTELL